MADARVFPDGFLGVVEETEEARQAEARRRSEAKAKALRLKEAAKAAEKKGKKA